MTPTHWNVKLRTQDSTLRVDAETWDFSHDGKFISFGNGGNSCAAFVAAADVIAITEVAAPTPATAPSARSVLREIADDIDKLCDLAAGLTTMPVHRLSEKDALRLRRVAERMTREVPQYLRARADKLPK